MIELPRAALVAGAHRAARRVLLLRHQRPHADGARLLARRRRAHDPRALRRRAHRALLAVRDDRPRGRRRARADGRRERARRPTRSCKHRRLRRARRRPRLDRVLRTGSGSTTSPARRSACRSLASPRRRPPPSSDSRLDASPGRGPQTRSRRRARRRRNRLAVIAARGSLALARAYPKRGYRPTGFAPILS